MEALRFIFGMLVTSMLWLLTLSFIGLSVYIGYFSDVEKPVSGLVIGAGISAIVSIIFTGCMLSADDKSDKKEEEECDEDDES